MKKVGYVAVFICVGLFLTQIVAGNLQQSAPTIKAYDSAVQLNPEELARDLTRYDAELLRVSGTLSDLVSRVSREHASRARAEETIRQIEATLPRREEIVNLAKVALSDAKRELEHFEVSLPLLRQVAARRTHDFELQQSENRSARFRKAENDRAERNRQRAKFGSRPEDQEEALRERQLKRTANGEFERVLGGFRESESRRINDQLTEVQGRLNLAECALTNAIRVQEESLDQLAQAKIRVAESDAFLQSADDQIVSLKASIALLETRHRTLAELTQRLKLQFAPQPVSSVAVTSPSPSAWYTAPAPSMVAPNQATDLTSNSPWQIDSSPRVNQTHNQFASVTVDQRFDPNYRPPVGEHWVNGYHRRDGTYVRGHHRTNRDSSFWNNHSSLGNRNPHTGVLGHKTPGK